MENKKTSKRKYNPSPKQAVAIGDLIEREGLGTGSIAEIGVFWGETTFYLLDRFPDLDIFGIDLWEEVTWGDKSDEGFRTYEDFPLESYYKGICEKQILPKYQGRLTVIRADSVDATNTIFDKALDLVFIDGDHTAGGVERDVLAWLPKIKKGGWITGHDVHMPGVKEVVERFFPGWEEHDNFVWAKKV